ncbi:MAG TPA: Rieske 2Fe-2S domain-containing protein [Nitrospiria bacterium]
MSEFVTVAKVGDIPSGEGRVVEVKGTEVALFNMDGAFFAIDNYCVHQGGPLGEGRLEGEDVLCPWHSWRYNIKTGLSPTHPSVKVKTYPVRVENDEVKLSLA